MTKKLLILASFVIAIVFANAQSLSLTHDGVVLEPNEEVTMTGPASNDEIVIELDVTNNGSSAMNVLVKKVENYLVEGSENTFCWGLCFPPFVYESPSSIEISAGGTNDLDFSGHYNPKENAGTSSISYVFFDENNPDDSVMVVVLFAAGTTGIGDQFGSASIISSAYPNPANNFVKFDYTLDTKQNATMRVYSLIGSLVKEYAVSSGNGTIEIETAQLEEGFYFYTLSSGNEEMESGKFVVKH